MKESISTSYLFMAVIIIIGLCAIVIIGGLSYSKAFKIKNRMIEIIEKYKGYNSETEADIEQLLNETGYPVQRNRDWSCPKGRGEDATGLNSDEEGVSSINNVDNYKYCIYQYKTIRGYYYSVVTYMPIELPMIGDFLKFEIPIYGDTKVFLDI